MAAFACLWGLALLSLRFHYTLTVAFVIPAAFVLVRLFVIQHDCAHRSFFRSPRANDIVGSVLGVLTLTPHAYWRRVHAIHHGSSGNLDKRGLGDIETLTVREYQALNRVRRIGYRVYRNPVIVLVVGPVHQFFVHHRLPGNLPLAWRTEWSSVLLTNLALAAVGWAASRTIGIERFFLVHLPVTWLAGSIGILLFYVQHQFEQTYWAPADVWRFESASLEGSSYLDLPPLLQWCTGNIGIHHVHHLCARIPNYRLRSSLDAHPALRQATRLTLRDSLKCLRLKLWDADRKCLVGFADVARCRVGPLIASIDTMIEQPPQPEFPPPPDVIDRPPPDISPVPPPDIPLPGGPPDIPADPTTPPSPQQPGPIGF
jgi:omega-6 fatty acid desaturase (delta-12 desaturase)